MSDDLKPCPFCGSTELRIERSPTRPLWEVECYACWGVMTSATSQSKAEHDWNRRWPEDALRARAEAAEQRAEAAEADAGATRAAAARERDRLRGNVDALRARAEAAEQRAEALAAELAQARADRALLAGLWLGTVPHDVLPALFPETLADRGRLAAALDAVDRQTGAEARIAAGRAVIARIVAETGGGAA